ncbi:MAG: ABC transporter permease [Bdellovibrionales bacterium]
MIFLALRHLLARQKQTLLIFSGILLGTITYVFVAGIQLGFREYFIEQIVDNDAHIKISAHEEIINPENMTGVLFPNRQDKIFWAIPPFGKRDQNHILYPVGWFQHLDRDPRVLAYSEQLQLEVLISRGGTRTAARLIGVQPEKQKRVTHVERYMTEGTFDNLGHSGQKIIVGEALLRKLGGRVGEALFLTSGKGEAQPFRVVGSFSFGVPQVDEVMIYGALRDVQSLGAQPGRISHISVKLSQVDLARGISDEWAERSYEKVQSWDQANANFLHVFKIQDLFRAFITIGILAVAGFGIYNVLSIIVNQKRREIAILRALGYPPNDILILFLTQGLILGFLGAMIGCFLGFLLCYYLQFLDFDIGGRRGLIISFDLSIYYGAFSMAFLSSVVASVLPARAASQFTPIDIIRMEG